MGRLFGDCDAREMSDALKIIPEDRSYDVAIPSKQHWAK